MTRRLKIAAIGGDGIWRDSVEAGAEVPEALGAHEGFALHTTRFDRSSDRARREGRLMAADGVDQLRPFDAICFGTVGDPGVPDHITLQELRLAICQGPDQCANVRPTRLLPGMSGPLKP